MSHIRTAPNPHITSFMKRHQPTPGGNAVNLPSKINEEDTLINYPKDVQGTILLCAPVRGARQCSVSAPHAWTPCTR